MDHLHLPIATRARANAYGGHTEATRDEGSQGCRHRFQHDGEYALVASKGGAPEHPLWYHNLKANPEEVTVQDGPEPFEVTVRELTADERAAWWERAVAAYPPYAEYQGRTDREIPVFLASPTGRR